MRVEVKRERAAWARYRKYVVRQNSKTFTGDDESRHLFLEWQAARAACETLWK